MNFKVALAGNPNSGKTTLFNRLTGSRQHVGNWPGVTIEKKEGSFQIEEHGNHAGRSAGNLFDVRLQHGGNRRA